MSDPKIAREPDRAGSAAPIPPVSPATDEDLARMDEAATFWERSDVRQLLEGGHGREEVEGAGE